MSDNRKELLKRKKELEDVLTGVCGYDGDGCSTCAHREKCKEYNDIIYYLADE